MPELPEVERIRLTLAPALIGARVCAVRLHRRDVVKTDRQGRASDNPQGRCGLPRLEARLLHGAHVADVIRHGKQLAIVAEDGRTLCVQLGMSGQLFIDRNRSPRDHVHCEWELRRGRRVLRLVFRDPRRFGGLRPFSSERTLRQSRWELLGPDALQVEGSALWRAVRASRRSIKAALLDQAVLAGVGNIYADEALFRAAIDPKACCGDVGEAACERLAAAAREVLARAVACGGTTLRDYVDGEGAIGGFMSMLMVYGRAGQPCRECGTALEGVRVAQRMTVFCPVCQSDRSKRRGRESNNHLRRSKPVRNVDT